MLSPALIALALAASSPAAHAQTAGEAHRARPVPTASASTETETTAPEGPATEVDSAAPTAAPAETPAAPTKAPAAVAPAAPAAPAAPPPKLALPADLEDEPVEVEPPPRAAPAAPSTASSTRLDAGEEQNPLYLNARGSVAVPANGNGDVVAAGGGLGIVVKDHHQVGLRFIYMHQPPENPLALSTPEVPWAWGPVLDWQYTFKPETRASMFIASSLGYVYGTPKDGSDNVILPILEGGIGLRLSKKTKDGSRVFIAPQIGFVPGAVAPFTALDIGMILPGRKNG